MFQCSNEHCDFQVFCDLARQSSWRGINLGFQKILQKTKTQVKFNLRNNFFNHHTINQNLFSNKLSYLKKTFYKQQIKLLITSIFLTKLLKKLKEGCEQYSLTYENDFLSKPYQFVELENNNFKKIQQQQMINIDLRHLSICQCQNIIKDKQLIKIELILSIKFQ
ncbi:unnamed protein product [Paramecium octaurelia]|uniref:Uncharacterized protein n=1 Tax=Paramecium octaurelia TaxID=43137 RepID=A0A8S1YSC6_PAROT|nr:unnamed protein product [Paramecium octaurelia]